MAEKVAEFQTVSRIEDWPVTPQGWLQHGVPLGVEPKVPLEVISTGASLGGLRYWSVTEQNWLWGYPGLFLQSSGLP